MLVNGQWYQDFHPVQAEDEEGGFVRQASVFRNWITPDGSPGPTGEGGFKAEAGRYHLYVALICPWASRTLMVRTLKGLEDAISVTVLDPRLTEKVWQFGGRADSMRDSQADPLFGAEFLYEIYLQARPDYTGQITVPVLWDKQRNTIVNNESSEIIRMMNEGFDDLSTHAIDLYPADLRNDIDEINGKPATDPTKVDTDGDSFSDPDELIAGTDPNDPDDNPFSGLIANSVDEFSGVQGQDG